MSKTHSERLFVACDVGDEGGDSMMARPATTEEVLATLTFVDSDRVKASKERILNAVLGWHGDLHVIIGDREPGPDETSVATVGELRDLCAATVFSGSKGVVDVVAAVRRRADGSVWLCKRSRNGKHAGLAGMWEYPGGKVDPNEQLRDALVRELTEEFGDVSPSIGAVLDSIEAKYGDITYRVTFFAVDMDDPTSLNAHDETRWMTPREACSVDHLPSGTAFNAKHLAEKQEMVYVGALPPDCIAVERSVLKALLDGAENSARWMGNNDALRVIQRMRGVLNTPDAKGPTPPSDLAPIGG